MMPGSIVSGAGIQAGTTVVSVDDFNQITLSLPLSANVALNTTIYFSPAPGMYVYGSRIGLDSKVVSVDSTTQITVSVPHTHTFASRPMTFVPGWESEEFACIPQLVPTITNTCLQSNTLATTWTASGITPTNATYSGPLDDLFGVTAATLTATRCIATAANGTLTQTVQTGVGSTWMFSVFARVECPSVDNSRTMKLKLGTSETTFNLTNRWTRYSVTFTTIANTTDAVITLPRMGTLAVIQNAMVTLGSSVPCPITPTTTTPLMLMPQQNLNQTTGALGWNIEGGSGIELNPATVISVANGQKWFWVHMGTTSNFAITDNNQIWSSETITDYLWYFTGGSVNITVDGYEPLNITPAMTQSTMVVNNGCLNTVVKNSKFYLNGTTTMPFSWFPIFGLFMANCDIYNPKNYVNTYIMDTTSQNNSNGIVLQNVRCNKAKLAWTSQTLGTQFKGVAGLEKMKAVGALVWDLNSNTTLDGFPISSPAVYDSMFHEMTFSKGDHICKGSLDLLMSPSTKATKPYSFPQGTTAYFDNYGRLYFQTAGSTPDQVIIEWPNYIKGITSFDKKAPHVFTNDLGLSTWTGIGVLIEYDLDKGTGYSNVWKRLTGTCDNIAAETGINPAIGVKIKLRLTARQGLKYTGQSSSFVVGETIWNASSSPTATAVVVEDEDVGTTGTLIVSGGTGTWTPAQTTIYSTAGATRATVTLTNSVIFFPQPTSYVAGIKIYTNNDTDYRYPLATPTLTLTGLKAGSEVRILRTSDSFEMGGIETSGTSFAATYDYSEDIPVNIIILHPD